MTATTIAMRAVSLIEPPHCSAAGELSLAASLTVERPAKSVRTS
jgi:hypothetical protein